MEPIPEDTEAENSDEFDAEAMAEMLGLSDKQFKFAMAKLDGANDTQAAKQARYAGNAELLRSAGHKAKKSPKVSAFLRAAFRAGYGISDEPGDLDELEKCLWKLVRGDDKRYHIQATKEIREIQLARKPMHVGTPQQTLDEIAQISPGYAISLARKNGIGWNPEGSDSLCFCPTCRQVLPLSESHAPQIQNGDAIAAE